MSSVKILKTLGVGKGATMNITVNESEPEGSVDRYSMDTYVSGEEQLLIPPHWHKEHAEYLNVLEGRMEVTLNGEKVIVKAGDPPILVARRVVHSIKSFEGERLVFREKPDPGGLHKALFFNDVFQTGRFGSIPHLLRAFLDGDSYLALPFNIQALDEIFIMIFGNMSRPFVLSKPEEL
ncbi:hypothetical protein BJ166DRAFT_11350 [Pestalotiopsis sp. NC0098]|nr:hypothetical protein BJ166DRAFT_11350 [Pestalotiopsis sp. NC0098]